VPATRLVAVWPKHRTRWRSRREIGYPNSWQIMHLKPYFMQGGLMGWEYIRG
jgi:hypothetical protein